MVKDLSRDVFILQFVSWKKDLSKVGCIFWSFEGVRDIMCLIGECVLDVNRFREDKAFGLCVLRLNVFRILLGFGLTILFNVIFLLIFVILVDFKIAWFCKMIFLFVNLFPTVFLFHKFVDNFFRKVKGFLNEIVFTNLNSSKG